tara:strand:+ start:648 stop:818 length:171 start_codon:yes stop_codon:yes gene_type:complete
MAKKETFDEWTFGELLSVFEQGFITKGEYKNAVKTKKKYAKKKPKKKSRKRKKRSY